MVFKKRNDTVDNMEIVDNILNDEKERIQKLNESIQPEMPEGVSKELLEALKEATTIPQMADSNDKAELEKSIDKEIAILEEKAANLSKMHDSLQEKLKKRAKLTGFKEFWK